MKPTAHMRAPSPKDHQRVQSSRGRLVDSTVALVEDLRGAPVRVDRSPETFCADFQVCLPYQGLFVWNVEGDAVVGDANQVIFVRGGESSYLSQPVARNFAELIITPNLDLLTELAHGDRTPLARHPLFHSRSRRIDYSLQRLRTQFLHDMRRGHLDGVEAEERVVDLLRHAMRQPVAPREAGTRTRRLIARTKVFLEGHFAVPVRLADVARAVGASPAYLTDVFRRIEGVPLHAYLMQLRLGRSLLELPHAADLTRLALGLGFSSHSHFTAAFRRAFGCTPSQFRESTGRQRAALSEMHATRAKIETP